MEYVETSWAPPAKQTLISNDLHMRLRRWCQLALILAQTIMSLILLVMVATLCVKLTTTLADVTEIVPEIQRVLTMVTNICNSPDFKVYCQPQTPPPSPIST